MLNINKKTDIKNILMSKKNIIASFPVQNTPSELNNAAKIFNLGIDIFIFDASFLTSKSALELGYKLQQLCSLFDILFFVKDRVDLARLLNAQGIYLDDNSYDVRYAKQLLSFDTVYGGAIESENDNIDEFDFVISKKSLNTIKPCYTDVLYSPKTLSRKVFISTSDISLIKKYRKIIYGCDCENEIS